MHTRRIETHGHGGIISSSRLPLAKRCVLGLTLCVCWPLSQELASLKTTLLQSLMLLPEDSLVGLISFGKNVHIHELSFDECPKSYVFR